MKQNIEFLRPLLPRNGDIGELVRESDCDRSAITAVLTSELMNPLG